jgi:GMP synthase (glutamine-hydrolysing)
MKHALALRHVHFEDLGTLAVPLAELGYAVEYRDAALDMPAADEVMAADLLVVLGGPLGAYEEDIYPFLAGELGLIGRRLAAGRPTLGICLGAQLMARALGARVHPSGGKEIGWSALALTEAGRASPLAALEGAAVLHWHGDTYELPAAAVQLASTPACAQQAFAAGRHALGLQFHLEIDSRRIESWLVGHACELAQAGIDVPALRAQSHIHGLPLAERAARVLRAWLEQTDGA